MDNQDKQAFGAIGGASGGMVAGGKAGLALGAMVPPLAPFFIFGGIVLGAIAGGKAGARNPASGAVASLSVVAGLPTDPTNS